MVRIEGLTFTYPGAETPVLKNICTEIEQGDFLAVIGNNGCGKSTLCKTLNGLIPHFLAGDMDGTVEVDGMDTREYDLGDLTCKVGYVYQDFENQIVCPTVLEDASYACLNYAMEDYRDRGSRALEICGLSGKEQDYVWQLSGGQKHLLALAGAAALSPQVLILDEPIAQLDPAHARMIYDVLRELNQKHGKTILVIEHHTEYIAEYCSHVLLMRDGQVRWKLPAAEALRRVEELRGSNIFPPQVTLAAYDMRRQGLLQADIPLPVTIEEGKRAFGALNNSLSGGRALREREKAAGRKKQEVLVSFRDVVMKYRAVKGEPETVFDGLNLEIRHGEKIALIGSNGAGKSTLLKLIMGLLKPGAGQVLVTGRDTRHTTPEKLGDMVSLVYQNPEEMFVKDSIQADVEYAMKARRMPDYSARAEALLKQFRLEELAQRDGRLLSGGQMRRASLAIGIALNPQVLLLDEPTANLDIATRREIMKTLNMLKGITDTVLIATHDMQLVCDWAERIVVLCGGRVIADGSREEIFSNEDVCRRVGIRPPEIYEMGRALGLEEPCFTIADFVRHFQQEEGVREVGA